MTTRSAPPDPARPAGPVPDAAAGPQLSRRTLLAGTAGLTVGALAAGTARAQHDMVADATRPAGMTSGIGSLSNRAYPVPLEGQNDIAHDPADLPGPLMREAPATVRVELETVELEARLDNRASYRFWTFNGSVPGPFLRARVGDTIELRLSNREDSWMMHNIDLHAVTGPGGGAEATNCAPGESAGFRARALKPGLFVYHCAVPPVALHMSSGMYGMILIEPDEGLPPVDREFYVMQGEVYTAESFGTEGLLTEDFDKLMNERPEYFVFNGHVAALTEHYPMQARVGETVRIFFGVGGPNHVSSVHLIGSIFERVYLNGDVVSPPQQSVQTVVVPAGGAAILEAKFDVPGRFVLVDHALSRVERGLAAYIEVTGPENPDIFAPLV